MKFSSSTAIAMILILVALALNATQFAHAEAPPLKAGLWEAELKLPSGKTMITQNCLSQAILLKILEGVYKAADSCSSVKLEKKRGDYTHTSNCKVDNTQMIATTTLTGDFQTVYTAVSEVTYTPAVNGISNITAETISRYKGECSPGMRLGDSYKDGKKVGNILDTLNSLKKQ